jgi:hypothetical protein
VNAHDSYNALASQAQLLFVDLISCEAKVWKERLPSDPSADLFLYVPDPQWRAWDAAGRDDMTLLLCGARLRAYVLNTDKELRGEEPRDPAASVIAEYELLYSLPPTVKCEPRACEEFAMRQGVMNAWPFFRELVHSFGGRFGVESLVLSLLRLGPRPRTRTRRPPHRRSAK